MDAYATARKYSGRARAHASERCRRDGTEYGRALESLSGTGRRKSATTTFVECAGAMLRTLAVRAAELTSVARSAVRWQQKRCLAHFIGRLCDRLFDRTSTRPRKTQLPSQHQPSMTASEREELRRRMMEVRRQRREAPTDVLRDALREATTMFSSVGMPHVLLSRAKSVGVCIGYPRSRTAPCCFVRPITSILAISESTPPSASTTYGNDIFV